MNTIDSFGDSAVNDLSYYGADVIIKYSLSELLNCNKLEPYLGIGGGYTWVDEIGAGTFNGTFGLNYWFNDNVGITAQSSYKHSFEDNNLPKHFQHSLGVSIKFGGKDTDGDGIYDKDDACPEVAGLAAFNGCPDSDGDGIEDSKDDCPNTFGLAEFNGCPDSDGDGIRDIDDECPNEPGPAANGGCPWPDSDGDGVLDKDDECPNEPGTVANHGCPELSDAVKDALREYAKTILFKTGKSDIKFESGQTLGLIVNILKEYPRAHFNIDGHTDSVGSEELNQKLSKDRSQAVVDWLVENGIERSHLVSRGFGESQPLMTNDTRSGRERNRRVEINLIKY